MLLERKGNFMTIFNKLNFLSSLYFKFNNSSNIDKADGNLVRYFQIEYGREWESALEQHLHEKSIDNVKKAA